MTLVDNQTMRVVRSSYAGAFTERHDDFSFRVLQDGNLHYLAAPSDVDGFVTLMVKYSKRGMILVVR